MNYSTDNEKKLNEQLDKIRKTSDELKGLYGLRAMLIEVNKQDLSRNGYRELVNVVVNELARYAYMASEIWFDTEKRQAEAIHDELPDKEVE